MSALLIPYLSGFLIFIMFCYEKKLTVKEKIMAVVVSAFWPLAIPLAGVIFLAFVFEWW